MLANIGVEQGVPISAKTAPKISGYKKSLLNSFFGISFIIGGKSNSRNPSIFKPIIITIEATINAK
ncbi:unknown [Clostridium sp. CAG:813]|nr:unknown [Clostridium sp. CAG:813]